LNQRTKLAVFSGIVVAATLAVVMSWRGRSGQFAATRQLAQGAELQARSALQAIPMKEFAPPTPADAIEMLGVASVADGRLHTRTSEAAALYADFEPQAISDGSLPRARAEVLEAAGEFMYFRFAQPDPAAYREWRRSKGYKLRSLTDIKTVLTDSFDTFCGHPIPADATSESVFDEIWRCEQNHASRRGSKIRRFADNPEGVCIAFASIPAGARGLPVPWLSTSTVGAEGWYFTSSASAMAFYEAPFELQRRPGGTTSVAADCAIVGMIVECESGDRGAIRLAYFRFPGAVWRLESVTYSFESGKIIPPITY